MLVDENGDTVKGGFRKLARCGRLEKKRSASAYGLQIRKPVCEPIQNERSNGEDVL